MHTLPSNAPVNCRPATPADRSQWISMRHELWPDCPLERHALEVEQLLANPGVVLLAEVDRELAGFAEVSIRQDHVDGTSISPVPYLEGWFVRPPCRRRGVGRALIAAVERWASERGYSEIASDAELHNSESIRLHGLLGFREVERTMHFVKAIDAASEIEPHAKAQWR